MTIAAHVLGHNLSAVVVEADQPEVFDVVDGILDRPRDQYDGLIRCGLDHELHRRCRRCIDDCCCCCVCRFG